VQFVGYFHSCITMNGFMNVKFKCNSFLYYTGVLTVPPVTMELETHTSRILTDVSPQFTHALLINSTHERMTK
jgi:hypothetical protein